ISVKDSVGNVGTVSGINLTSGGAGTFSGSLQLSSFAAGTYHVSEMQLKDNAGNLHDYLPTDFVALGINTAFTIIDGTAHPPGIASNGGGATATVSIPENSTAVTTVSASDPDAGTTLTYVISGGDDAALFQINASTGALSFKGAPNFEVPTDADHNN